MDFTSKLISFRLVLLVNGRGESGRLPSLILSAPDTESEWDRSSELDNEEENDTLPRCRRLRFRRLLSRS
jgi:hypothetical protein